MTDLLRVPTLLEIHFFIREDFTVVAEYGKLQASRQDHLKIAEILMQSALDYAHACGIVWTGTFDSRRGR